MRVSHEQDHVTHAVVGGEQSIDFGVSDTAEFYHMMSSTLYRDQILAVVREVLCNAWDAHIDNDIMDKPVRVTLNPNELVIRDFGKGISKQDIGPIYGVYGLSTKKNDGKQTGGFGLGSKSPFAYTDHFDVVSYHQGIKTIYNMSKSSAQKMGKPSITPIASLPTEESGLSVKIKIKDHSDFTRFKLLIHRIAYNGDMNVELNGELLPKLEFDTTKSNYLVIKNTQLMDTSSTIYVRYGNVIYPVEYGSEIESKYDQISGVLRKLASRQTGSYQIIFQAPPNSISVTPSRESLSMQEHTIDTLRKLFDNFMKLYKTEFYQSCSKAALNNIDEAIQSKDVAALLSKNVCLPSKDNADNDFEPKKLNDINELADKYVSANYPAGIAFRRKDIARRINGLIREGVVDRGLAQSYIKQLQRATTINTVRMYGPRFPDSSNWLQRKIVYPVIKKMDETEFMSHKKLYVFDDELTDRGYKSRGERIPMVPATGANLVNTFTGMVYLRKIVVISYGKLDMWARAKNKDIFDKLGNHPGFLFYHTGRKIKEREEAVKFFTDLGMNVIDLTKEANPFRSDTPQRATPRKKKKGLAKLSSVHQGPNHTIDIRQSRLDSAERITEPKFAMFLPINENVSTKSIGIFNSTDSRIIVELFGDEGGLAVNNKQLDTWLSKPNIKTFKEYVAEKVINYLKNNKNTKALWEFDLDRTIHYGSSVDRFRFSEDLLKVVFNNAELRIKHKLPNPPTPTEIKYFRLWKKISDSYTWSQMDIVKDYIDELEKIPLSPVCKGLVDKIIKNDSAEFIKVYALSSALNSTDKKSKRYKIAREIFDTIFDN
jgi:hypothetical protein